MDRTNHEGRNRRPNPQSANHPSGAGGALPAGDIRVDVPAALPARGALRAPQGATANTRLHDARPALPSPPHGPGSNFTTGQITEILSVLGLRGTGGAIFAVRATRHGRPRAPLARVVTEMGGYGDPGMPWACIELEFSPREVHARVTNLAAFSFSPLAAGAYEAEILLDTSEGLPEHGYWRCLAATQSDALGRLCGGVFDVAHLFTHEEAPAGLTGARGLDHPWEAPPGAHGPARGHRTAGRTRTRSR